MIFDFKSTLYTHKHIQNHTKQNNILSSKPTCFGAGFRTVNSLKDDK